MTLKLGLIGCSNVAKKNLFSYIESSSSFKIHSIGSRSFEKSKKWAKQYNIPIHGDYNHVLNSGINVVYISLPISMHEEWSIKAAKKGIHVICEKSSTTSLSSAIKMVKAAKENNVRLLEAFSFRFHPQHKIFKQIIKSNSTEVHNFYGSYGMPAFSREDIRWNKDLGGGILIDVACYPICASRIFFEKEPINVFCSGVIDKKSDVDTKIDILAQFPDGKVAFLSGGFDHYYQSKYSVWTKEMKLELQRAYAVPPTFKTKIEQDKNDEILSHSLEPVNQYGIMFEDFFSSITKNTQDYFNYEDDLINQAAFMEAARISLNEKRLVRLSEI